MTSDDLKSAAKDTAADAGNAASQVGSAGSEAASNIADKARDAAAHIGDTAGAAYEQAKDRMSALRDQMPGSAGDAIEAGRRTYAEGSERLGRQVARQPIEALLLAGAIGYLVGWAANRS